MSNGWTNRLPYAILCIVLSISDITILCKVQRWFIIQYQMNTPLTPTAKALQRHKTSRPLEPRIGCISCAMEIIGNKWTALILRDLTGGAKRFGELERSLAGISPRTLSQRLDDLAGKGILLRQTFAEVPPRCEYSLTPKGQDLIPILRAMSVWGEKYSTKVDPTS